MKYKVMSTTHPPGHWKDQEPLWFPKLTGSSCVDLDEMCKILSARSTASRADIYLVIYGLEQLIPELLAEGKTVKLGGIGSFRLHAKVEPAKRKDDVSAKNIKELRLSFRPGTRIKNALKKVSFKKVK